MTKEVSGAAATTKGPDGKQLRRTKSAEDFALAFGDVELHLNSGSADEVMPLPSTGNPGGTTEYDELADFSEYWASNSSGLPPKDPGTHARWNKQQQQHPPLQHHHSAPLPPKDARWTKQQQSQYLQRQNSMPQPIQQRSMLSGATSPTEAATETGTQASESWTGTHANDDIVSTLSNDTDDCDTASRSSVKRRRMTQTSSGSSFTPFQPLAQVNESGDAAGSGENEPDVRPWKVDIPDHDVVLGDTHEPTWGTRIYREIRKPYAKKTITNEQLKHVKTEFQRRLEKELGKKLPCPPRFWCNKESKTKAKPIPVSGFLKSRPGITYAYAKDQAIKEDIKNASARSRTRISKQFTFKGSLSDVVEKALEACDAWVGDDIDRELYARGFKEDIERMVPWRAEYIQRKEDCEEKASCEAVMRRTHMREAKIHETHANHLETAMVEMINQLGNMMIEAHRADTRKSKAGADGYSVEDSSAGGTSRNSASRNSKGRSSAGPKESTSSRRMSTGSTAKSPPHRRTAKPAPVPSAKPKTPDGTKKTPLKERTQSSDIQDMDLSPIDVRKGQTLSQKLEADAAAAAEAPLESIFSQNLRMSSLEDIGGNRNLDSALANVVVMPPGLPREVKGGNAADELSVLSAPDDLSLLFMESRESAIRRGIDQPAALPQPGHVADRTKALLQQMKHQKNSKN